MTERQILLFYAAEQRQRMADRAQQMIDMAHAFAGGKEAETHFKSLLEH